MIQLHNNIPVCILDPDEHGIALDLKFIHKFICDIEPKIMELEPAHWFQVGPTQDIYEQDDLTSRWTEWNIFLYKEKKLHDLFRVFCKGVAELISYLDIETDKNLYMGAWANLCRAGEIIPCHAHNFFLNGHIAINADNTFTIYEFDQCEVSIPNKNGQLILTLTGFNHWTSPWKDEIDPRTTVAVDILDRKTPNAAPVFPIFLP